MHMGLTVKGKLFEVSDVFAFLEENVGHVNNFLGLVFGYLRKTLKSTPVSQTCGFVDGRILMRLVDPSQQITFDNGTCESFQWFEKEGAPKCPFVTRCGAYAKTRPHMDPLTLLPKMP
jgi:hypothetical protein